MSDWESDPYVAAYPELRPFWEAAERGVLALPWCTRCSQTHWHPRAHCPFCHCERLDWRPASGRGTLHTFSVIPTLDGTHVLAYVLLAEGPLVLTTIVEASSEQLRIGAHVRAIFQRTAEGRCAPMFTQE